MSLFLPDIFDITTSVVKLLTEVSNKASEEKENYIKKLESSTGDDVFKYVLLINIAALEGYIAQTRIQASQSFRLSQIVAIIGFLLLSTGIIIGAYLSINEKTNLDIAYLSTASGILTEFISGIFFYLYNKSLSQINRFHDRLVAMQQTSISFLATSLVTDEEKRNNTKIELAKEIMKQAEKNQTT